MTGLVPGESYKVLFRIVNRPGYAPARVQLLVGGNTLADVTAPSAYTAISSTSFVADAATMTVTFQSVAQGGDNAAAIDTIQVVHQ